MRNIFLSFNNTLIKLILFFILNSNHIYCQRFRWYSDDPDLDRSSTEIISSRGFIPQTHTVVTEDGYILTVFRIVNPFRRGTKLRPIYLQHGLFGNSNHFLLNERGVLGPDGLYVEHNGSVTDCNGIDESAVSSTLPFVLAACAYDVWLGNGRGNRYSSRHVVLDPNTDLRFWDYSVDHLGLYDVPAVIRHIMHVTNSDSIGYIGHSLGTTMMFELLSTQPEYTHIIKPFIALAPVVYVGTVGTLILRIGALFEQILGSIPRPFFGVTSPTLATIGRFFGRYFCGNRFLGKFCEIFLYLLVGFDSPNTNTTRLPAFFAKAIDGTSTIVLSHMAQRLNRKDFSYYDYGSHGNTKRYGQSVSPKYNVSRIVSKNMILFSSVNDICATPTDVDILRSQLTVPLYGDQVIRSPLFNHAGFLFGLNTGKLQNAKILQFLKEFDEN